MSEADTATSRDIDEVPGQELAVPQSSLGPPGPAEWEALKEQARWIAASSLVKPAFQRKESNVMLAILQGRELQLPPLAALTNVHIIEGVPTMSAKMQMALVKRAGHFMRVTESTDKQATVRFGRRGEPRQDYGTFTYTLDDAQAAGLLEKKNWRENPKAMLRARAITAVTTMEFPDVLMGVTYSPDELGAIEDPETGEVTGADAEIISVEQAWSLKHRLDDLRAVDEKYAESAREQLRERGLVLYRPSRDGELEPRLPVRRLPEVDEILVGLEQWMRQPAAGDDDVAEGQVVGEEGDPPPPADAGGVGAEDPHPSAPAEPDIEEAEIVPEDVARDADTGTEPVGAAAGEAGPEDQSAPPRPAAAAPTEPLSIPSQHRRFAIAAKEAGLGEEQRHALIGIVTDWRTRTSKETTKAECDKLIAIAKHIGSKDLAWEPYDFGDGQPPEETVVVKTTKGQALLQSIGLA